jgi:hypothetical protein
MAVKVPGPLPVDLTARLKPNSLMESRWIDPERKRRCDDRKNNCHEDKHGKDLGVENTRGKADIEYDEFHQTRKRWSVLPVDMRRGQLTLCNS